MIGRILIMILIVCLITILMGGIVYVIIVGGEEKSKLADKECKRLGFDKYVSYEFDHHCIKGSRATKVYGNCAISDCDLFLERNRGGI